MPLDPEKVVLGNVCLKKVLHYHCYRRESAIVEGNCLERILTFSSLEADE